MSVFSIGVTIHATLYIKAASEAEAYAIARDMRDTGLELHPEHNEVPISGRQFDDPELPDVHLSPAMTLGDPEPIEFMEQADG